MSKKRIRSSNWDEEEKQLFLSCLKDYAQVIENKALDNNTNKSKHKAWDEVCKKFNELNSRHRDLVQLKIQWKTMKIHARKSSIHTTNDINEIDGELRPESPNSETNAVTNLLNQADQLRDDNYEDNHVSSITHSKILKNIEHRRFMQMAEEEHAIKMIIHKEKLKCVILEREILELKKLREKRISELTD